MIERTASCLYQTYIDWLLLSRSSVPNRQLGFDYIPWVCWIVEVHWGLAHLLPGIRQGQERLHWFQRTQDGYALVRLQPLRPLPPPHYQEIRQARYISTPPVRLFCAFVYKTTGALLHMFPRNRNHQKNMVLIIERRLIFYRQKCFRNRRCFVWQFCPDCRHRQVLDRQLPAYRHRPQGFRHHFLRAGKINFSVGSHCTLTHHCNILSPSINTSMLTVQPYLICLWLDNVNNNSSFSSSSAIAK